MSAQAGSPYASGGGGTIFEYDVAAVLLGMLLRGAHAPGMHLPIVRVALQQRATGHPLDDIVVFGGRGQDAPRIEFQVKSRINPVPADKEFISFVEAALISLDEQASAFAIGMIKVGLIARPTNALDELAKLCQLAQAHADDLPGMRALLQKGIVSAKLRTRWSRIVGAVGRVAAPSLDAETGAHRLLVNLFVWQVDLGSDGADTRRTLDLLDEISRSSGQAASALLSYLRTAAQEWGPRAGSIDRDMLRRELHHRYGVVVAEALLSESGVLHDVPAVRQLPARPRHFSGRAAELVNLESAVPAENSSVAQVTAIVGKPGVGKTALAVEFAHRVATTLGQIQLYVDLRGVSPTPADPAEVLRGFLRSLGVTDTIIPDSVDQRAALYRSILAHRRSVVVLDNAADANQVRDLLPGGGPSMTIVTSRSAEVAITTSLLVTLEVLGPDESVDLLVARAGRRASPGEPALPRIAALCGHLPLALHIAGTMLAGAGSWSPTHLERELSDRRERLDALTIGEEGIRAAFHLSYMRLPEATRRTFRRLSVVPAPSFEHVAAADAAGCDDRTAVRHLKELATANLLERSEHEGRYRFHDLIRVYAAERLLTEEDEHGRTDAEWRLINNTIAFARRVAMALDPEQHHHLTTHEQQVFKGTRPIRWLDTEWSLVRAVVDLLAEHRAIPDMVLCLMALERYVDTRDLWRGWLPIVKRAANLALAFDKEGPDQHDKTLSIAALTALVTAQVRLHQPTTAAATAERLLGLLNDTVDQTIMASALNACGNGLREAFRSDEALNCYQRAYDLYVKTGDQGAQARCEHNMASVHRDCGRFEVAVDLYRRDLTYHERVGDRWQQAWTLNSLGGALERLERFDEAVEAHTAAFDIAYELGDPVRQSSSLHDLGLSYARSGQIARAVRCHLADLEGCARRGDLRGMSMALVGAAIVGRVGAHQQARLYATQALAIARLIGDHAEEAGAHERLGELAVVQNDIASARDHLNLAIKMFTEAGMYWRACTVRLWVAGTTEFTMTERREQADCAITVFKDLGATFHLEEAEQILTDLRGA
ncbi:ATP-binding protein [Micromonospora sp. NPDC048898]|uniref:ATP-binding protein n=1 Tax=Micromonospora sp. NPDC048898 TaxID=3364260 RepID=UPI00371BFF00